MTLRSLAMPFHLYNLVKLPLSTHDDHDFYCRLATEITALAFVRSSVHIIQISEPNDIPPGKVWYTGNAAISFLVPKLMHER